MYSSLLYTPSILSTTSTRLHSPSRPTKKYSTLVSTKRQEPKKTEPVNANERPELASILARPDANHALSGLSSACVFGAGEADCVFGAAAGEANCVFVAGEVDCVFGVGEVDCVYGAATGDVDCVFSADEADCVFGAGEADCVFSRQVLAEGLDALSRTVPASRALSKLLFRGEEESDLVLSLCTLLRLRTAKCPDCGRSIRGFPSDGLGVDSDGLGVDSEPCDRRACFASIFCTET